MLSRRHVLALLAASPLITHCGPALPDPIAAWRDPGAGEADPRRFALAHAILAPNPHNRQPWLVDLTGADEIVLHADLERLLPSTDPFDRQIVVGCGAFLELLDLAARSQRQRAEITLWPEGEPQPRLDGRPFAHVRFVAEANAADPLFEHILARRTNREPFEARDVAPAALDDIAAVSRGANAWQMLGLHHVAGGELRDSLRTLAWDAFEQEFRTPAAHGETVALMRVGKKEIATHRDGIAIQGPMVELARAVGLVNKRTLANIDNDQTREGLEAWRPLALDAPAFLWITSTDNTRATQIEAGRAYARANLAATRAGLAVHPWSQALQEYPEMATLHTQAETLLNAPGEARVQMLARVGYGPAVDPAPRRGLSEHIRA